VQYVTPAPGDYKVAVSYCGYPIKNSPVTVAVDHGMIVEPFPMCGLFFAVVRLQFVSRFGFNSD
jgi:hypothetical protein